MRPTFIATVLTLANILPSLATETIAPDELLAQMRAKDAAIEGRKLEFVTSGVSIMDTWNPNSPPRGGGAVSLPPEVRFQRLETLVVLGAGVTYTNRMDPRAKFDQSRISAFYKASNVDGTVRSMNRGHRPGERCNATLEIHPRSHPLDVCHERAMAVKFALGIGFGERIRAIESLTAVDAGYRVTGTIQIWWEDYSTFDILVDANNLVRKATLDANVGGHRTRFEVTTEGVHTIGPATLAAQGSFRRTNPDYPKRTVSAHEKFNCEFRSLSARLTEDEYKKFIAVPEEPGMQVHDWVTKVTYVVGDPKSKHAL